MSSWADQTAVQVACFAAPRSSRCACSRLDPGQVASALGCRASGRAAAGVGANLRLPDRRDNAAALVHRPRSRRPPLPLRGASRHRSPRPPFARPAGLCGRVGQRASTSGASVPRWPRGAGLSGSASRDVISHFSGRGSASPAFTKTRYSRSATSSTTARMTEWTPHRARDLLRHQPCSAEFAGLLVWCGVRARGQRDQAPSNKATLRRFHDAINTGDPELTRRRSTSSSSRTH